jgi:hypothetical protein
MNPIIKLTIKQHTDELVGLSLTVARQKKVIEELLDQNKQLFKDNWHLNYKLSKLLEALQFEWKDNKFYSTRKKK